MADSSLIPNSTQIPNVLLDLLMPFMREGERAVLMYLCRRTYGFHREEDSISLEQFEHGLNRDGRQLDFGCGMKRRVIIQALAFLQAAKLVERVEGGLGRTHISLYRINLDCELVQILHQLEMTENTSKEIVQIVHQFRKGADCAPNTSKKGARNDRKKVQNLHPIKKQRETKKKTRNKETPSIPLTPAEPNAPSASPSGGRVRERFEQFWHSYPRRVGKGDAWKVWQRLHPDDNLTNKMLQAIEQQRASPQWTKEGGQFIPHPSTWLRQQRWEDEPAPVVMSYFDRVVMESEAEHANR